MMISTKLPPLSTVYTFARTYDLRWHAPVKSQFVIIAYFRKPSSPSSFNVMMVTTRLFQVSNPVTKVIAIIVHFSHPLNWNVFIVAIIIIIRVMVFDDNGLRLRSTKTMTGIAMMVMVFKCDVEWGQTWWGHCETNSRPTRGGPLGHSLDNSHVFLDPPLTLSHTSDLSQLITTLCQLAL